MGARCGRIEQVLHHRIGAVRNGRLCGQLLEPTERRLPICFVEDFAPQEASVRFDGADGVKVPRHVATGIIDRQVGDGDEGHRTSHADGANHVGKGNVGV